MPTADWVSPAGADSQRAEAIHELLPGIEGVAAVHTPQHPAEPGAVSPVMVNDDRVEVHIVVEYGIPVRATADNVVTAVDGLLDGRDLKIVVEDIVLPGEQPADVGAAASGNGEPTPEESDAPDVRT